MNEKKQLEKLRDDLNAAMGRYLSEARPDCTPEVKFEYVECTTLSSAKPVWVSNCKITVSLSV